MTVGASHDRVHDADAAAAGGTTTPRLDRFTRVLHLTGELDDDQRASLVRIADRCTVHTTLEQSSVIVTELADR